MATTTNYGNVIREARERKGWTQVDLAEAVGEAGSTVSNWENERVRPSIEQGNDLIIALTLSAETFWRSMGAYLSSPRVTTLPTPLTDALLEMSQAEQDALTMLLTREAAAGSPRKARAS